MNILINNRLSNLKTISNKISNTINTIYTKRLYYNDINEYDLNYALKTNFEHKIDVNIIKFLLKRKLNNIIKNNKFNYLDNIIERRLVEINTEYRFEQINSLFFYYKELDKNIILLNNEIYNLIDSIITIYKIKLSKDSSKKVASYLKNLYKKDFFFLENHIILYNKTYFRIKKNPIFLNKSHINTLGLVKIDYFLDVYDKCIKSSTKIIKLKEIFNKSINKEFSMLPLCTFKDVLSEVLI